MKQTTLVPQLRYPAFTGEWQVTNIGEVVQSIDSGWSPQCGDEPAGDNEWGILKTTCVVWEGYNERANKRLPEGFSPKEQMEVRPKDILVTRAGPTERVGVVVHIDSTRPKLMLSDKIVRMRCCEQNASNFIARCLSSKGAQAHLLGRKSGLAKSQTNISQSDLKSVPIIIPTLPEQQKIADFLTAVDGRIQQLIQKKALLQDYKKGVMQQLFTQALRFKDDHGNDFPDWEEKTLGDVLTIGSGRDYKHLGSGDIPVYGSGGVMTFVDASLYEGESVCIGRKGTIDKPQFLDGAFWTVDTLFYTHSFKRVIPRFIYAVFQQISWRTYNEASGVPSLSKSTIESIPVSIPHPVEQTKIANFLTALDRKIESVSQQITHTQTFKRGLLQQMFV